MRRKLFGMLAAVQCLIGTAAIAQTTSDYCGRLYVAPEVLGMFPTKKAVKDTAFVGLRFGYELDENIAIELESGWAGMDIRHAGRELGELNNTPLLANIRYGFMGARSPFDVFLLGGLGVAFNDFSVENELLTGHSKSGTFAAQAGAGVSYSFTPEIGITAEARYYWNDPRVRVSALGETSPIIDDINSDAFMAGGSVFFKF